MSPLERVDEVIQERRIYHTLHQETPHAVSQVKRPYMQRRAGGIVEIEQDLVVKSNTSHDSIIAERSLATIQQTAQGELER